MKGIAGIALTVGIILIAAAGFIGTPVAMDALEEAGTIDLPEENPLIFQIERFGETIRMIPDDVRLQERIQEYGLLNEKYEEFWDDMQVNFEYVWREIERKTNMTREEIITLARQRMNEAIDKLRTIHGPGDCEGVFGEDSKLDCVGQWKTMPFRWKGEQLLVCYWACQG
jgi:hypothetical protein